MTKGNRKNKQKEFYKNQRLFAARSFARKLELETKRQDNLFNIQNNPIEKDLFSQKDKL